MFSSAIARREMVIKGMIWGSTTNVEGPGSQFSLVSYLCPLWSFFPLVGGWIEGPPLGLTVQIVPLFTSDPKHFIQKDIIEISHPSNRFTGFACIFIIIYHLFGDGPTLATVNLHRSTIFYCQWLRKEPAPWHIHPTSRGEPIEATIYG